jgi:hypothetical protein
LKGGFDRLPDFPSAAGKPIDECNIVLIQSTYQNTFTGPGNTTSPGTKRANRKSAPEPAVDQAKRFLVIPKEQVPMLGFWFRQVIQCPTEIREFYFLDAQLVSPPARLFEITTTRPMRCSSIRWIFDESMETDND